VRLDPRRAPQSGDGASDIRPLRQLPKPRPSPASRMSLTSPELSKSPELRVRPKRPSPPEDPVLLIFLGLVVLVSVLCPMDKDSKLKELAESKVRASY
jgi:hypothetical protein